MLWRQLDWIRLPLVTAGLSALSFSKQPAEQGENDPKYSSKGSSKRQRLGCIQHHFAPFAQVRLLGEVYADRSIAHMNFIPCYYERASIGDFHISAHLHAERAAIRQLQVMPYANNHGAAIRHNHISANAHRHRCCIGHGHRLMGADVEREAITEMNVLAVHLPGKTFNLRCVFCALTGACDAMSTPRPLGPLMDVAAELGGDVSRAFEGSANPAAAFAALLAELGARATVLIVEDAHWADAASIDLLRFLSRRIGTRRALLIVTCRDPGPCCSDSRVTTSPAGTTKVSGTVAPASSLTMA